jgi:hypothetical protein
MLWSGDAVSIGMGMLDKKNGEAGLRDDGLFGMGMLEI